MDADRPLLLDLFSGAGGCAAGYHRAGFDVVGVDVKPQPRYPFPFVQMDALEAMRWLLGGFALIDGRGVGYEIGDIAAIHASPPCQAHTTMSNRWRGKGGTADSHANLIEETRRLLEASGRPYVIENVPGAARLLRFFVVLSGGMFGLGVHRPRLFESSLLLLAPPATAAGSPVGVYGKACDGRLLWRRADGTEQRAAASLDEARAAMGIDWMDWGEIKEAVPPAYTEFVGRQLVAALKNKEPDHP